jgi:hypothetical protein
MKAELSGGSAAQQQQAIEQGKAEEPHDQPRFDK